MTRYKPLTAGHIQTIYRRLRWEHLKVQGCMPTRRCCLRQDGREASHTVANMVDQGTS
jgi:hypothetical protein